MNNGQCSKDAQALVFLCISCTGHFCQAIAQICHILIMIQNYLHSSSNNSWAQVSWANRHSIPKRQMPLSPEFFVLIRLADWRIRVPITCLRKSCNLFWASQRKSMQTLFPVSALLWLIALHLLVLSGNTDKFRHWKKQLWSCLREFHSSMSDLVCVSFIVQCCHPFSSIHRLHSGIRMFAPRATAIACKCIELIAALCLFCVCFLCTHWSHCVCSFLFLSAPQSAQRTSVVKSGKLAIQRSFRLRSFLSLRLGPFHDPCPCLDSREHSDDHHLDSAKQKHYLFLQKTKLYRAAHHPFISVGLKLLDGLEWTMMNDGCGDWNETTH